MPRASFLTIWQHDDADPGTYECVASVSLSGKDLVTKAVQLDFQGKKRTRFNINYQGLLLPGAGELTFALKVKDGPTASVTIPVESQQKTG